MLQVCSQFFFNEMRIILCIFCRTSVRLDRRHYNAWYGIGLTYYKQERFQLAEIYYRCSECLVAFFPFLKYSFCK